MSNAQNVSTAKPKIGGALYSAPLGTKLPKDAISDIDSEFKSLGYVSEDGMSNENTPESEDIIAWGGDVVATAQTSKADTFTYTMIEATNINVLKEVYGQGNVSGNLETGIEIKANNKELEEHCLVIDMILKGGILKRIVIPSGKVTEVGEIEYKDDTAVGYETTISSTPDEDGNTHYEYIQKPAGSGTQTASTGGKK